MEKVPVLFAVPLIVAVPLPGSAKVTPLGNAPDSVRVGAGFPDATTVNDPLVPTAKAALLPVGIVGEVGAGGAAGACAPPPLHPARNAAKTMVIKMLIKLWRDDLHLQACGEKALRRFAARRIDEYTRSPKNRVDCDKRGREEHLPHQLQRIPFLKRWIMSFKISDLDGENENTTTGPLSN